MTYYYNRYAMLYAMYVDVPVISTESAEAYCCFVDVFQMLKPVILVIQNDVIIDR